MRMTVRQTYSPPGEYIHERDGAVYEDVALFADGLRLAGYFTVRPQAHYRDKALGYEDWTFDDVTKEGRDAIVIALTWKD